MQLLSPTKKPPMIAHERFSSPKIGPSTTPRMPSQYLGLALLPKDFFRQFILVCRVVITILVFDGLNKGLIFFQSHPQSRLSIWHVKDELFYAVFGLTRIFGQTPSGTTMNDHCRLGQCPIRTHFDLHTVFLL